MFALVGTNRLRFASPLVEGDDTYCLMFEYNNYVPPGEMQPPIISVSDIEGAVEYWKSSGGTGENEMRKAFTKVDPPGFLLLMWSPIAQTSAVAIDHLEIRRGNCEKTGIAS